MVTSENTDKRTPVKITGKIVKSLVYRKVPPQWDVQWDTLIPGFGVRIYPSGKKTFVISYRVKGRKRLMALAAFGIMTVDEARDAARRKLVEAKDDIDPLEKKRRQKQGETFGSLSKKFIREHSKPRKKSWGEDERRIEQHIPKSWRSRRADSITGAEVSALHSKIGETHPYEANRVLALLHIMFRLAMTPWGFIPPGSLNPADGVEKFAEKKRKRFVKPDELPDLAKAIDREPNVYVRSAIWLYLLTGLRKNELLNVRRSDIDYGTNIVRLADTKAGEEQFVALSSVAMAVIQATPAVAGNAYLLPGAKSCRPLVNINKPWDRIRMAAGLDDVRLHDLRRTVGSWMTQASVDLNIIKEGLRHANISTTLTYARLGHDPAREAMEQHGRQMLAAAGRGGPTAVTGGG